MAACATTLAPGGTESFAPDVGTKKCADDAGASAAGGHMTPILMMHMDLEGRGEDILTAVRNYATLPQWGDWLRVPLSGAAAEGNVRLVNALVAAGANAGPGQREDGATLLHAAAEGGSTRILDAFLSSGCGSDIDRKEHANGLTALHVAAEEGHSRIAGALIRAGATVDLTDSRGRTPLHSACLYGRAGVVVDLLLRGSDAEGEDDAGARPLYLAAEGGHREIVELLLRAGANPDCEQRVTGRRPLYAAALGGHYNIMTSLIDAGAEKDAAVNLGRGGSGKFTALHAAAELGGVDAVTVLIEKSVDLEARSNNMSTALHLAASAGTIDTVMILLNAGADIEARDAQGSTPLRNGCKFLRTSVVSFLVDWGADTTNVDDLGLTMQQSVGTGIADGTDGKDDRVIDMLDLLGYKPATPLVELGAGGEGDRIADDSGNGSFLGAGWSFKKVSGMLSCIGNSTAAVK